MFKAVEIAEGSIRVEYRDGVKAVFPSLEHLEQAKEDCRFTPAFSQVQAEWFEASSALAFKTLETKLAQLDGQLTCLATGEGYEATKIDAKDLLQKCTHIERVYEGKGFNVEFLDAVRQAGEFDSLKTVAMVSFVESKQLCAVLLPV